LSLKGGKIPIDINATKSVLYELASQGWFLFPVKLDKTPYTEHGFKNATQTQLGINEYLGKFPGCQWAGYFVGQYIVDIDVKHGDNGYESLAKLEAKYEKLPPTRRHKTGSGGMHILFKQPSGYSIGNTVKLAGFPGVDRRGNGGYIVLPPFRNQDGAYEVVDKAPIVEAPKWLLDLQPQPNQVQYNQNAGEPIPRGQQDVWLFSRARYYRGQGDTDEAIFLKLKIDIQRCKDQNPARPYTDRDLQRIAKSASRYSIDPVETSKPKPVLGPVPLPPKRN